MKVMPLIVKSIAMVLPVQLKLKSLMTMPNKKLSIR
jgi:hypothetical protein